ncbi:transcription elongation protein SprT [Asaia spathodeae]|uniref:Transcription elongation protein SprT n=1 Tax=Asaia spathodeae TaxID=657016 RepID=A0ABX2P8B5_9PROT|nr:transcription elongation protein SprT [Asaia spathodeae]GBR16897.1 hypothetical protein AA105894_1686 [Asaia spathodeae NBRC 105894]
MSKIPTNVFALREEWLQAAISALRPHFQACGFPLPVSIRAAIGFPSKGSKSTCVGECWASVASADQHNEIFIRPDQAEPLTVLGILVHELVHACIPLGSGHGPVFREAAIKVGLVGKMREAMPGTALNDKLSLLTESLGPLPHATLDIGFRETAPRAKKKTHMLKAYCPGITEGEAKESCDYIVRLTATHARKGAPICGVHSVRMIIDWPEDETEEESSSDAPQT